MSLEETYLEHILLHLRSNDPDDGVLTTYLNSWFAHQVGGDFLYRGRPRWLSRGSSKKLLAHRLHAISFAAREAHVQGRIDDLVIDHAIPSAEIIRQLKTRRFESQKELRTYLKRTFTLALLTKQEHDHTLKPFKSIMAEDWNAEAFQADSSLRYCRYRHPSTNIRFEIQHIHED